MKIIRWLPLIAALILAASCHATETGNPCTSGSCPVAVPNISFASYTNDTYGIMIVPPDGWTFEKVDDDTVIFTSPEPDVSTVRFTFERLDPKPESLFAYLSDTYPDYIFKYYSTANLTGYIYDDPEPGENGEDLREYFFLFDDVLVHAEVAVFPSRMLDLWFLFNGIVVE